VKKFGVAGSNAKGLAESAPLVWNKDRVSCHFHGNKEKVVSTF
jgi:hypothetical protein